MSISKGRVVPRPVRRRTPTGPASTTPTMAAQRPFASVVMAANALLAASPGTLSPCDPGGPTSAARCRFCGPRPWQTRCAAKSVRQRVGVCVAIDVEHARRARTAGSDVGRPHRGTDGSRVPNPIRPGRSTLAPARRYLSDEEHHQSSADSDPSTGIDAPCSMI